MSVFADIKEAPIDPILGTTQKFNADADPRKINLGVGAYRDEAGKPYVLDVVKDAEAEMLRELGNPLNKEYIPIDGLAELKPLTQELIFGKASPGMKAGAIASTQALSGTGALRCVAEFIMTYLPAKCHEVWMSDPTWGNHNAIFKTAGMRVQTYPYWDAANKRFDCEGMIAKLNTAPEGTTILLHACAHNPTGMDPTEEQWKQIAAVMKARKLVPIVDSAYQGYASGDLEKDAFAVHLLENMGFQMFLCQSFAKNIGLYGERIGMIHVVCADKDESVRVLSQLKLVVRAMYSSPPKHGAHLVVKILGNPARRTKWEEELKGMAMRIHEVRSLLKNGLVAKGTPGSWDHVTTQIGMFSYTGLSPAQCERLTEKHHIYLLKSGRISLAGLNKKNTQYMVDSVDEVVRNTP